MKLIPLSGGHVAKVDDQDFDRVSKYNWTAHFKKGTKSFYAERNEYLGGGRDNTKSRTVSMHRLIMKAKPGELIDHKDSDTLNNQRNNLRVCTRRQNNTNRKPVAGRVSKFIGVGIQKGRWRARIRVNLKGIHLGYFSSETDAAIAYNKAAIIHHGEFAKLNEI